MTVEKILWTMSNWDCISMQCTQKNLLNVLSVVRGAVGWQNSKTTCESINHKTMWANVKKTQNLLSTISKWRSIRRYMKMFPVLSATNPLEQDEIWRGIWKMSTRQEISMKRQGTQTDHTRTKIWMMIQLILTIYHSIWHSLLMTDATNKSFRLYHDILEAPRFYRQPRSLKFGYFCELNSTGASEVLWEPQR